VPPRKARRLAVDARSTHEPHRPRNPTLPRPRSSLQAVAVYDGRDLIGHVRPGKARGFEALDAHGRSLGRFGSVQTRAQDRYASARQEFASASATAGTWATSPGWRRASRTSDSFIASPSKRAEAGRRVIFVSVRILHHPDAEGRPDALDAPVHGDEFATVEQAPLALDAVDGLKHATVNALGARLPARYRSRPASASGNMVRASGMLPDWNIALTPAREVPANRGLLTCQGRHIHHQMDVRPTLLDDIASARIPDFRAFARHDAAGCATTEPGWRFRSASGIPGPTPD
jgi:hypothetical protein